MGWALDPLVASTLASSVPGLTWVLVGLPFDVVRVRLQTTSKTYFKGPIDCLTKTLKHEGPLTLWRGLIPQLLMSVPYSTIMFSTYTYLRPKSENPNFFANVYYAGSLSGIALCGFHPIDVWRTRLQTKYSKEGVNVLWSLMKQPSLFFRGMSMTCVRNIPGNGIFFTLHEFTLAKCHENNGFGIDSGHLQRLLCGGITGILFNLLLYPADVVRSRMIVTAPQSGGPFATSYRLYKDVGLSGFWRGAGVTTLKAFPVNAAGFWALHIANKMLEIV